MSSKDLAATTNDFAFPTDYWRFPPFGMLAFPGFIYEGGNGPAVFRHPDGHCATIEVRLVNGEPTLSERNELVAAAAKGYLKAYEGLAESLGAENVRVKVFSLPDGAQLLTFRGTRRVGATAGYALQYIVLSKGGDLALISVEGVGEADSLGERLEPIVKAAQFAA